MVIGDKETQIPGGTYYRPVQSCGKVMRATHGLLNILVAVFTKEKKKKEDMKPNLVIYYMYVIYMYII